MKSSGRVPIQETVSVFIGWAAKKRAAKNAGLNLQRVSENPDRPHSNISALSGLFFVGVSWFLKICEDKKNTITVFNAWRRILTR